MVKLKKYRVHKSICDTCNGNGFIKIINAEDSQEVNVHQCWECDSEGEFYIYENQSEGPRVIESGDIDGPTTDKFLH